MCLPNVCLSVLAHVCVLVSTGENCNRGAALGALLGSQAGHLGKCVRQEWKDGLQNAKEHIPDILQNLL